MTTALLPPWPPAHCPPLAWPILHDQTGRTTWQRAVVDTYAALWVGHSTQARLAPAHPDDVIALETRLDCVLPPVLRLYHLELGALSLAERLCGVADEDTPIQALADAFPGITDIVADDEPTRGLAAELVVFGDYLGNGNMFCFHRRTGEVYYFDHDSAPALTFFFPSPEEYLDALMVRCLAEIHDDEEAGERILEERFGRPLVEKWLY